MPSDNDNDKINGINGANCTNSPSMEGTSNSNKRIRNKTRTARMYQGPIEWTSVRISKAAKEELEQLSYELEDRYDHFWSYSKVIFWLLDNTEVVRKSWYKRNKHG